MSGKQLELVRRRSIFQLPVELCYRVMNAIISIPASSFLIDHDILLDAAFWDDTSPKPRFSGARGIPRSVESSRSNYEVRLLRSQLEKTKVQLDETTNQLELARMESRACKLDIARLSGRVHDLEDEVEAFESRVARQESQNEALQLANENLQRRNSGLWLINAGLRHDLTEMIIGKEDGEMMGDIVREAEKEEWEELVGETLIAGSPDGESESVRLGGISKGQSDCDGVVDDDDTDAMTEVKNDVIDEAEVAMGNLMVGNLKEGLRLKETNLRLS